MNFKTSLFKPVAAIILAGLFISGCGYKFTGDSLGALQGINTLAIEFPLNRSSQAGLEGPVNEALKRKFLEDGRFSIVYPEKADALIRSTILDYSESPFSYRKKGEIKEFKSQVKLEFELIVNQEIKVRQKITRHRLFATSPSRLLEHDLAKKKAFEQIAADLAEEVYLQLMESF